MKNGDEKYLPMIDYEYASSLYYFEFKSIYDDKETGLDLEDFIHGIKVLNAIASINKEIDEKFSMNDHKNSALIASLTNPNAHLQDFNPTLINLYKNLFFKLKSEKLLNNDENNNDQSMLQLNSLLTHSEIQECIYDANDFHEREHLSKYTVKFIQ